MRPSFVEPSWGGYRNRRAVRRTTGRTHGWRTYMFDPATSNRPIPRYSPRRRTECGLCRSQTPATRGTGADPARSSGSPSRPFGIRLTIPSRILTASGASVNIHSARGERKTVGPIALTVIPVGPSSQASALVMPSTAAFEAQ